MGHIENHPDHEGERGLPYKRKIKDASFDPDNSGSEGDEEIPVPDEKPQIEDYESVEEYARAYEKWREAQSEGSDAGGSEGSSGESEATLADVLGGE